MLERAIGTILQGGKSYSDWGRQKDIDSLVPAPKAGFVKSITVTAGGTGYAEATTTVTIADTGGGTGATATAVITSGVITAITVTAIGSGYIPATTTVTIADSGSGTGATATATVEIFSIAHPGYMAGKRTPMVSNSLNPTATRIPSEAISGSVVQKQGQAGRFAAAGAAELEVYANDMLLWPQVALNTKVDGLATPFGSAAVKAKAAATGVTDPNELLVDYNDGNSPKAHTVAAFITDTSGTTVTFAEIQSGGAAANGTPAYDKTSLTSQTLSYNYIETPGKIKIQFGGTTGIPNGTLATLTGLRKTGLHSLDREPESVSANYDATQHAFEFFTGSDDTDVYFTQLLKLQIAAFTGTPAAATIAIHCDPDLKETAFTPTDEIYRGLSGQLSVGGEPWLVYGAVITNTGINFSGETVRLQLEFLARALWARRTLEGGIFEKKLRMLDADLPTPAGDTDADSYLPARPEIESGFFPYYGILVGIDAKAYLAREMSLNLNNNYQQLPGVIGNRISSGFERNTTGREIPISFGTYYLAADSVDDTVEYWTEHYLNNITKPVDYYAYYWTDKGKEYRQHLYCPKVEFTDVTAVNVNTKGSLEITLPMRAVIPPIGQHLITWTVRDDNGWI